MTLLELIKREAARLKMAGVSFGHGTANAFDEDRRACEEAGMNDFVGKPIDPEHLLGTVLRWSAKKTAPPATGLRTEKVARPKNRKAIGWSARTGSRSAGKDSAKKKPPA